MTWHMMDDLYAMQFRGALACCLEEFGPTGRRQVKGEVVLLVAGCPEPPSWAASAAAGSGGLAAPLLATGLSEAPAGDLSWHGS
jgi:hypothetical protein